VVTISAVRQPVTRQRTVWIDVACWLAAGLWGIVALTRWLGYDGGAWPIVLAPALTPYLTVAALVPVAACLIARRWLAGAVALAVLVALVAFVAPRAFGGPDPARGPAVRVLAANLKEGDADPRAVVDLVRTRRVDLLAVSELPEEELTALSDAGLTRLLPYGVTNPGETTTGGTALFSRYPLSDGQRIPLVAGFVETAAVLHVPGAVPVAVTVVHYCAPADPVQYRCWAYGLSRTPPADPAGPVRLLLGDFNLTLDYGALRDLLGTGYRDAAAVTGDGLTTTWPYDGTPVPPLAIDHVLADRRIGVSGFGAYPVRRSDHRAVFAALTLPRS
jgi:endonuclease/exonuclease/phosphatase (EEP) superfamily protein YafD